MRVCVGGEFLGSLSLPPIYSIDIHLLSSFVNQPACLHQLHHVVGYYMSDSTPPFRRKSPPQYLCL